MTKNEMLTACRKQLIFEDFLLMYNKQIRSLMNDFGFLIVIQNARGNISPAIEFCRDNMNPTFISFKQGIGNHFLNCGAFFKYPDYQYIANDVARRGIVARGEEYKLNSAAISVYYAIRFYQVDKLNIQ